MGLSGRSSDSQGGVSACREIHQHACFQVPGLLKVSAYFWVSVCVGHFMLHVLRCFVRHADVARIAIRFDV